MQVLPEYLMNFITDDNYSGYINLPSRILDDLKDAEYPLIFKISTKIGGIISNEMFCGVKEFTDDDMVVVPEWMMENLMYPENGIVKVEYVKYIPPGKYIEIEPLEEEFFNIPDYDVYLEQLLSDHCILQKDMVFKIKLDDKVFNILVKDVEIDYSETNFELLREEFSSNFIHVVNRDIEVNVTNKFLIEKLKKEKAEKLQAEKLQAEKLQAEKLQAEKLDVEDEGIKLGGKSIKRTELRKYYEKYYKNS